MFKATKLFLISVLVLSLTGCGLFKPQIRYIYIEKPELKLEPIKPPSEIPSVPFSLKQGESDFVCLRQGEFKGILKDFTELDRYIKDLEADNKSLKDYYFPKK